MIKKMLAMLAIVSCAFGAWADATHINGTDFSGLSVGTFVTGKTDSGADPEPPTTTTYWFNGATDDFSGNIVLGTNGTDHVLDFESNITNPVYRTINGCYGATSPSGFTPQAVGTGLFIDTLVQFTPYLVNENHAAPSASGADKLIVWVRETEVENDANVTNLIVTAGYYDAQSAVSVSNYVVNLTSAEVSALCNGQQRLTIKSFANITAFTGYYLMGFVVYINEQPVSYTADAFDSECVLAGDNLASGPKQYYGATHQLFPSLVGASGDPADSVLSCVGYAGMGQIGNVYFDSYATDYPSFAGDNLNFDVIMTDGVTSYVYDNSTYTTNATFTVSPSTATITISGVQYDTANGWKHKAGTWYNGTNVVNNAEEVGVGDYGTFTLFANGNDRLTLAGFKANYLVFDGTTTNEYQTLYGAGGALAAALSAGNLTLNNDIVLSEEDGYLAVDGTLTIDLNGHTIQGTSADYATIENLDGELTIVDTSLTKLGKVLASPNGVAVMLYDGITALDAGTYDEIVPVDDTKGVTLVINGGTYYDPYYDSTAPAFYLQKYVESGKTVDWNQVGELWYATVSGSVVIPCDVTFSTNNVVVAEWSQVVNSGSALTAAKIPDVSGLTGSWDAPAPTAESVITSNTNFNFTVAAPVVTWDITFSTNKVIVTEWNLTVNDGDPIGNAIPNFTGGSWDAPAPTAETVVNSNTNFNYTIPYTLTYVTAHGVTPDGATYTNGAPNFALAAAPTADGWTFGGWLIGSNVFEAGDTYVVADHLEDTTATAIWTPTAYTLTYVTEKGTAPDAVSYTVESNNFALAAAPTAEGWTFAGWVIGSVTNEASATFVVADHLENTTATAAWVAIAPPKKFPQSDTAGTEYAGRDGTPALPFVIRNVDDLVTLKEAVADGEITTESFEVVSNITGVADWVGIGTSSAKFAGTLNGNGKTIDIAFAAGKYNGLFCYINNATISNLTVNVTGVTVSDKTGGAAFVGYAYGVNVLTAIKATGSLGTDANRVTHNAGGLVTYAVGPSASVTYNSCTNAMDVYSTYTKLGGLLGWASDGVSVTINNGVNLGNLSSTNTDNTQNNGVGGLIGWDGTGNTVTINGATSLGTVANGTGNAGSIYGSRSSVTPTVTGVIQALASQKPTGMSGTQDDNFDWATVDGDIATFVTPVATVDSVVAYKVMQANSSPNFTLAAAAASLTIDSSLAAYSGTVSVDESLAADYNLRQTAIATGVIYSLESKTPADPWAPTEETDVAASNKVVEIFGADSKVASKVTTLAQYEALVTYIKSVTSASEVPGDLTAGQKTYMWESFILGADPLFDEEPAVEITDVTANTVAGKWDFTVKVTEGESTDAYDVAADKVGALVKIRTSLSTGTWVAPTAGNIEADKLGGNLIKVTVNYGDGTSGFMKVSE